MGEKMGVSDSEFNMWRAVFAFSLVDHVLSIEEQTLLQSYLATVPFSYSQLKTLRNDFVEPQDVEDMYAKITEKKDKERFCMLARALVWSEGNMDEQERTILRRLSCMKSGMDSDILKGTRNHPHLNDYYQHYAKSGMVGLMKARPQVEIRV